MILKGRPEGYIGQELGKAVHANEIHLQCRTSFTAFVRNPVMTNKSVPDILQMLLHSNHTAILLGNYYSISKFKTSNTLKGPWFQSREAPTLEFAPAGCLKAPTLKHEAFFILKEFVCTHSLWHHLHCE